MKIITINDENGQILRKIAEEVQPEELESLQSIIDEMLNVTMNSPAIGLAAPQIGISKRICVIEDTVFINPEIIARAGKITSRKEGCLSVPGKRFNIKRSRSTKVVYIDREGNSKIFKPQAKLLNIAIQHEVDHLNGILVCDRGKEI